MSLDDDFALLRKECQDNDLADALDRVSVAYSELLLRTKGQATVDIHEVMSTDGEDSSPPRKVKTTVHLQDSGIYLEPEGYSEHGTADDHDASIVVLEVYEGRLRLMVWADINREEATHTIDLEGAKQSARKEQ